MKKFLCICIMTAASIALAIGQPSVRVANGPYVHNVTEDELVVKVNSSSIRIDVVNQTGEVIHHHEVNK